jgi:hypothetical protein
MNAQARAKAQADILHRLDAYLIAPELCRSVVGDRRAASIRAHRAAGVMWLEFVQAEADNAARQESRLAEMERNDWLGAWMQ